MSIFAEQDKEKNLILSSKAKVLTKIHTFKFRSFILTKTTLYSCLKESDTAPKKQTVIKWKRVEAFIDESPNEKRYILRLGHSNLFQEFFFDDPSSLDLWISNFRSVSILTDFDEDFVTIKEIGRGAFGSVYLVKSLSSTNYYAAKSISKESIMKSSRGCRALTTEIEAMRRLNHKNIVKLHCVYEDDEAIFLVMDYFAGGDLFQQLAKHKKIPESRVKVFVAGILQALQCMEEQNVIHRDLKLQNILLESSTEDIIKIADFGLASISSEDFRICGSPGFVAPEVLDRQPYNSKADIFSAGVVVFMLLSGKSPFTGKNTEEILMNNHIGKVYFHKADWVGISKACIDFILKLVDLESELRPSAEEALKHPWLNNSQAHALNLNLLQPPLARLGIQGRDQRCSSMLMNRINNMSDHSISNINIASPVAKPSTIIKASGIFKKLRIEDV
jgi:serine/threonine protein kinase